MAVSITTFTLKNPIPVAFNTGPTPFSTLVSVITQTSRDRFVQAVEVSGPANAKTSLQLPPGEGFPLPTDGAADTPGVGVAPSNSPPASTAEMLSTSEASASPASMGSPQKFPSQTSRTTSAGDPTSTRNSTSVSSSGSSNGTISGHRQTDSNSISPGAAAGIGIGCAVAGALIAAAILALLFRGRRQRGRARSDGIPLNGFASIEKPVASRDSVAPVRGIESNLPQPAEDQALGGEMSRLRTSIKNHVQSYYHTNNVGGSVDQVALGLIATGNMPLIASTLGSLLSNPATRLMAVRFCITWTVISRIDHNCEPSLSFLPPEIASCLLSISSTRDDPSTKPGFMSRWRSITAALLQDRYGSPTLTVSDPRNQNISEALRALDAVLRPFADEQRNDWERQQKLEEILRRGARFGFVLFSQPSLWDFDWNTPANAGRGTLVVSPGLTQITDDNGRRLPRSRMLEEQELARGLESYL
ncbi:MAG: hypothetical protein Q9166_002541 [cf. Caloplaca sp. 2 TL-2023]